MKKHSHQNTAIVLFSLTAKVEAKRKTYDTCSLHGNLLITEALESRSMSEAKASEIPVFRFNESNQEGSTFGEKLANAIENVYTHGYEHVLVMGNDCPYLTAHTLQKVHDKIASKQLILGDTGKDGVYLIGLSKTAYSRENFISLPWQKAGLINAFKAYASRLNITIHWEEQRADLNTQKELFEFIESNQSHSLALEVKAILTNHQLIKPAQKVGSGKNQKVIHKVSKRGPPRAA